MLYHSVLYIILTIKLVSRFGSYDRTEFEEKCKQQCEMMKEKCAYASEKMKEYCQTYFPMQAVALDMKEKMDCFVVEIDLPGVKKEDIKVEVERNVISVSGERTAEEDEDCKSHIAGRHFGAFDKRVELPESADMNTIMAKYENGVLTLIIHKKPECVKERRTVVIE